MVLCKNKRKQNKLEKDGETLSYYKAVFQVCHKPRSPGARWV